MTDHGDVPGRLFTFGNDPMRRMPAFITGNHPRCVLVLGGQTDSFFSLLFLRPLLGQLDLHKWSVAQVQLSSSLVGYGGRTHVGDAEDINDLLQVLSKSFGMTEVTLLAWGTGVQIAIELFFLPNAELITRVILQGAVCSPATEFCTAVVSRKRMQAAQRLVAEGHREALVSEDLYDLPISAARLSTGGFLTLQEALWQPALARNKEVLEEVLGRIHVPLLLMIACSTNYRTTDEQCELFVTNVNDAASTAEVHVSFFYDACDEWRRLLKGTESKHAATVIMFLQEQEHKRNERAIQLQREEYNDTRRSRSILAKATF